MREESSKGGLETPVGVVELRPHIRDVIKPAGAELTMYQVYMTAPGSLEKRTGYVSWGYKKIGNIEDWDTRSKLKEDNLNDEASIANIRTFYPFRYVPEAERQALIKNGVGGAILKWLIRECKCDGLAGIYCESVEPEMQKLLVEFGFKRMEQGVYFRRM